MNQLLRTKSIDALIAASEEPERRLKKSLGVWSLIALGMGAVIGSGIFTVTGTAAAGEHFVAKSIFKAPGLDLLLNGGNATTMSGRRARVRPFRFRLCLSLSPVDSPPSVTPNWLP